jgi:hypothetical protein
MSTLEAEYSMLVAAERIEIALNRTAERTVIFVLLPVEFGGSRLPDRPASSFKLRPSADLFNGPGMI